MAESKILYALIVVLTVLFVPLGSRAQSETLSPEEDSDGQLLLPRAVFVTHPKSKQTRLVQLEQELLLELNLQIESFEVVEYQTNKLHLSPSESELILQEVDATVLLGLAPDQSQSVVFYIESLNEGSWIRWSKRVPLDSEVGGDLALAAKEVLEETLLFHTWNVRTETKLVVEKVREPGKKEIVKVPVVTKVEVPVEVRVLEEYSDFSIAAYGDLRMGISGDIGPSTSGGVGLALRYATKKRFLLGLGVAGLVGPVQNDNDGILFTWSLEPFLELGYIFKWDKIALGPWIRGAIPWSHTYLAYGEGDNQAFDDWNVRFDLGCYFAVLASRRAAVYLLPTVGLNTTQDWYTRLSNDEIEMRTPRWQMGFNLGVSFVI